MFSFFKSPDRPESLFTGLRLTMAVTAFIAGASFCIADGAWHRQGSFYYINELPISWWVYGALLLIGAICIVLARLRPIGYLIGAIVYTFFSIAVWLAVIGGLHQHFWFLDHLSYPSNTVGSFFAACNITTICVLYWSALKQAIYAQVDPERVAKFKQL